MSTTQTSVTGDGYQHTERLPLQIVSYSTDSNNTGTVIVGKRSGAKDWLQRS